MGPFSLPSSVSRVCSGSSACLGGEVMQPRGAVCLCVCAWCLMPSKHMPYYLSCTHSWQVLLGQLHRSKTSMWAEATPARDNQLRRLLGRATSGQQRPWLSLYHCLPSQLSTGSTVMVLWAQGLSWSVFSHCFFSLASPICHPALPSPGPRAFLSEH